MNNNSLETPLLEVKNLTKHFTTNKRGKKTTVRALDGVSFCIKKGETFGLVGESGCGKTTTGRVIIRLYEPTSGEVYFDGKLISGKMNKQLRKYITDNISMVFQDPVASLNPRMTVQEIIGEGLKIRGVVDAKERQKKIVDMLERVGLVSEHLNRYPHEFSGGQRQRIGIARALVVKPQLIIADEPVSALDVSVQAQVINLLNELKGELDLTILFIAHDLSVVKYFSDRIGVMYFGRLVELADSSELFRNPMHPYTKALLSAIPIPDPKTARRQTRLNYDPDSHNYDENNYPAYHEIAPGHLIYCSAQEFEQHKADWR